MEYDNFSYLQEISIAQGGHIIIGEERRSYLCNVLNRLTHLAAGAVWKWESADGQNQFSLCPNYSQPGLEFHINGQTLKTLMLILSY